jgi:hypothetical protein
VEQQLYGQVRQPSRGSLGDFRFWRRHGE